MNADEVVQDVFLKLWLRAGQFDPARGSFTAWFMTIARHQVFDQLKHRRSAVVVAEAIDDLLETAPDPRPGPGQRAWRAERRATVLADVRELPAEQRRTLVLAYFGGLSQSAISELLGVPLGTVKKRACTASAISPSTPATSIGQRSCTARALVSPNSWEVM